MTRIRIAVILLMLAGSAACESPLPEEANAPATRLPAQLCKQAADGIQKLNESGGFNYSGSGEGTLESQAWLRMGEGERDQLLKLLAVDAACTAPEPPAEATATLHDETGRVLSQRVIETSADLSRTADDQ